MRQKFRELCLIGILSVAVVCFTGCGNTSKSGTSSGTNGAVQIESSVGDAMEGAVDGAVDTSVRNTADTVESSGYKEEVLTIPGGSSHILAMREVNGAAWIVTENGVYSSANKGSSWEKLEEPSGWIPESISNSVTDGISSGEAFAAISESGKLAFYSEEGLTVFETNGASTEIKLTFEDDHRFYGMKFADENTLVTWDTDRNIYVINSSSGSVTAEIPTSNELHYYFAPVNGEILTVTAEGAKFYTYAGELQEGNDIINSLISTDLYYWSEKSSYGGQIVEDVEKTGMFYASNSGLFHYMWGGGISEQLFEGSYTKLGDNDRIILGMAALSGNTVLCVFDDTKGDHAVNEILVRYDFSGTQEAVQTLTLFTLNENELLSDEINIFNQNNSDFHVTIEVGLSGSGGLTADDAIKILNTEILAGTGPDIIILDEMNVDAYCESGVLADLSGVLAEIAAEDGLYENIAYTYQTDSGAVYAVPARFQIPMMVSTQDVLDQITDLASLASTILALQEANPEMTNLIGCYDTILLERLMTFCSPAWLAGDGTLDEAKIREFLETVKTINEIPHETVSMAGVDEVEVSYDALDEEMEAVNSITAWQSSLLGFFRGNSLNTTAAMLALSWEEGLAYEGARGQSRDVFIPMQIVAVNANGSNVELALKFVKEFLSVECQSELSVNYRGYPVNQTGFWKMAEDLIKTKTNGQLDWELSDEEFQEMFESTETLIKALSNRSITDTVITDSVRVEGSKYLNGEIDLDTAVSNIMQTVNLHLAE